MINYQSLQKTYAPSFASIDSRTPYEIPGSHGDVYNALAAKNSAELMAGRNQSIADFENEKLAAQQNAALSGIRNLQQARQQQASLANDQRGMQLGLVNSLLSGLYR